MSIGTLAFGAASTIAIASATVSATGFSTIAGMLRAMQASAVARCSAFGFGDDHAVGLRCVEQRFGVGEIRKAILARVGLRLRRRVGDAGDLERRIVVQDAEMLAADQAGADDGDARRHRLEQPGRLPAVDRDRRALDVPRALGAEEQRKLGDILRLADAAQAVLRHRSACAPRPA